MKRKLFTFLVAFLATLSGAVWAETNINLIAPQSGAGVSVSGTTITIDQAGDYVITGSTFEYQVLIGSTSGTGTVNVTLSDATIELSDQYDYPIQIIERNTLDVILNIEGENLVSAKNTRAGITVHNGSSLTIEGTGILRTKGWCGIGNAEGACGNITIESGTVVAEGTKWCIGGAQSATTGSEPKLDMTGDALLVVYDESDNRSRGIFNMKYWGSEFEDPNDPRNHPNKGIYCNAKAQADFGSLYSDVTLQSPFPSDDFVINLNNHALTLSKGSYARKNQITGNGTLYAYDVTYDLNKKLGNNELSIADETPYTSIYCGPGVDLAVLPTATNSGPSWQCLGWTSDKTSYKAASVPANDIPDTPVTNPANQITATAVWAVAEWTTVNVNVGQKLNTEIPLIYPTSLTGVTIEEQEPGGILDTYGAKLDGTKIVAGDNPAGSENDDPENVTLNVTNFGNKTIVIPFKVNNTAPDLGDEDVTKVTVTKSLPYTGKEVDVTKLITRVTVNGKAVGINQFDVKYSSDTDGNNKISAPTSVGDYYVFIAAKDGSTSYQGESKPQMFSITAVMASVKANNKTITNPTSSTVSFESSDLTVTPLEQDELTVFSATISPKTIGADLTKAGIYNIQYTNITFKGAAKDNYTAPTSVDGQLTVKIDGSITPIDPNPGDGKEPIIKPNDIEWRWNGNEWTREYDGENHLFTAISVTYTDETTPEGTKTEVLSIDKDATVTYSTDEAGQNVVEEIKNQGTYYAHITITKDNFVYSGEVQPIKLVITARPITVTLGGLNAEHIGKDNLDANDFVTDWGAVVDNEKGKISGAISVADEATEGKYTVTFSDLALVDNGNFLKNNYTATFRYETTVIVGGNGEIEIEIPDWKPNEDIKPGEDGWTWNGTSFTRVYDGKEHPITSVQIKQGEDWKTVSVSNVKYVPKQPVKDAGLYWAIFTVEGKKAVLPLTITKREMKVTFNVPNHIESTDPITITDEYVNYEAPSGYRGLVTNEAPKIESGEFVFEESSIEGKYKVILHDFVLSSSNTFNPDNYILRIWDATHVKYVEYNNTGDDITIIDPENPEGNPNTPGEGVVVGPDDEGQQPSKNFCNIYVVEESSPYIQFHPSRNVVEAVGQITVDVVIPDEIEMDDVKLVFRRGNGEWETLTIDEETQKYTIKDINTHIYLKAEVDAALLDAEPDENHVYIDLSCTEDGIKLDAEREIVENGEDVLIWAEISKENLNKAIKYEYKVTRFGEWKELKATENAGEFMIWNVTNDVFVRAYLADQTKDPETTEEAAHHVYSDLSVTCKGLYLDADRKMVTDNGTTKVYLTIEPNYNAKNAHYMFRRGIHEAWEELTPSTEANVFVITGIESDIYLKATDAISTGMEDIDGTARIYTKDGSLYIYTPQQDDITVVSMTGAVVKRTKQIGLQSYPLNQGIYVVRVGEQVFKVRVK